MNEFCDIRMLGTFFAVAVFLFPIIIVLFVLVRNLSRLLQGKPTQLQHVKTKAPPLVLQGRSHRSKPPSHYSNRNEAYTINSCRNWRHRHQKKPTIIIFIKTLAGKIIKLDVSLFTTIRDIKEEIQHNFGISVHQQRLHFQRTQLFDESTIAEYNIRNRYTLHLTFRFYGGGSGSDEISCDSSDSDTKQPSKKLKRAARKRAEDSDEDYVNEKSNSSPDDDDDDDDDDSYNDELSYQSCDDEDADNWGDHDYEDGITFLKEEVELVESFLKGKDEEGKKTALDRVLKKLEEFAETLVGMNLVYIPYSELETNSDWVKGDILEKLPHIRDFKKNAVVYFRYKSNKVGRSVRPSKRWKTYLVDDGTDDEKIIVIFDYDMVPKDVVDKFDRVLLDISELDGVKFECPLEELTYAKIEEVESEGLSYQPRLLLESMRHDDLLEQAEKEDDSAEVTKSRTSSRKSAQSQARLGPFAGVGRIRGFRRHLSVNNAESGLQRYLSTRVDNFHNESARHEHLQSNMSEWERKSDKECRSKCATFLGLLSKEEREAFKDCKSMLSWPRGGEADRSIDACKVLIQKFILGILGGEEVGVDSTNGKLVDAITDPPPGGMFDADTYTDSHLEGGVKNMTAFVKAVETNGGAATLDTNRIIMRHLSKRNGSTTMTKWLTTRGWKRFFATMDMEAFRFTHADGKARIILVHRPLCYMLFSGSYTKRNGDVRDKNWNDVKSQATRAKTAHLLFLIIAGATESGRDKNVSIWGNLISAFSMSVFLIKNLRGHSKPAVLVAKNMIHGENLFLSKYHGLSVSMYGRNKREICRKSRETRKSGSGGKEMYEKDRHSSERMLNCLSQTGRTLDNRVTDIVQISTEFSEGIRKGERRDMTHAEYLVNNLSYDYGVGDYLMEMIRKKLEEAGLEETKAKARAMAIQYQIDADSP